MPYFANYDVSARRSTRISMDHRYSSIRLETRKSVRHAGDFPPHWRKIEGKAILKYAGGKIFILVRHYDLGNPMWESEGWRLIYAFVSCFYMKCEERKKGGRKEWVRFEIERSAGKLCAKMWDFPHRAYPAQLATNIPSLQRSGQLGYSN